MWIISLLYFITRIFYLDRFKKKIEQKFFLPCFDLYLFPKQFSITCYMFYKSTNIFYHLTRFVMSFYMRSRTTIIHGFLLLPQDWSIVLHRTRTSSTICRVFLELRSFAPTWIVSLNFICYAWNIEQVIKSMRSIIKFAEAKCPLLFG